MNTPFFISAIILFLLGAAHSLLGEKLLLIPISKESSIVLFKQKPYLPSVMRFAWHVTSFAWWGIGLVILKWAFSETPLPFAIHSLAGTFAVTGLFILGFSKGLHPAWFFFLVTAGCLWGGMLL